METIKKLNSLKDIQFLNIDQAIDLAKTALKEYTHCSKQAQEVDKAVYQIVLSDDESPNIVRTAVENLVDWYKKKGIRSLSEKELKLYEMLKGYGADDQSIIDFLEICEGAASYDLTYDDQAMFENIWAFLKKNVKTENSRSFSRIFQTHLRCQCTEPRTFFGKGNTIVCDKCLLPISVDRD